MTRYKRASFFGPGGTQFTRFATQNKPTEREFRRLFGSQAFLSESDDTATTSAQGLAKLASDDNIEARSSTKDADLFAKVVRPHQLTDVVSFTEQLNEEDFDVNNSIEVVKVRTAKNRTGGDGITYKVKSTFTLSVSEDNPFLSVNQSAAGANAEIDYDAEAFNTEVENSESFQALTEFVNESVATTITGKLGEIKMYSFFGEILGDTNCEFDENGIGRTKDTEGASGEWIGWIILMGQDASTITGATSSILNRYKRNGTYLVDTRQSYPVGADNNEEDFASGFNVCGENTHELLASETPVKGHGHTNNLSASVTGNDGGHYHTIITTLDGGGSGSMINRFIEGDSSSGKIYMAKTGGLSNLEDGANEGAHSHTISIGGGVTAAADNNNAIAHENKPLSFAVYYCVYVGATGSTN